MFEEARTFLPKVENILCDGGYIGQTFADKIKDILDYPVEIVKHSDEHMFKIIPKRWVVERCFARLKKARRMYKNVERKLSKVKQMVVLAFLSIVIRKMRLLTGS
jgi:transposase